MSNVVTAIFSSNEKAAGSLETLVAHGFDSADISLIASENFDRDTFAIETHSKLSDGVAVGATVGGATGAILAGLTTIGAISTGGLGLVAAGPIIAALTGAGAGAASGSILGGLVGLSFPEHEIKHYEDAIEKGHVMVGVQCTDSDQCDKAEDIFKQFNADKVSRA